MYSEDLPCAYDSLLFNLVNINVLHSYLLIVGFNYLLLMSTCSDYQICFKSSGFQKTLFVLVDYNIVYLNFYAYFSFSV